MSGVMWEVLLLWKWSDDESKSEQFITCAAFPGLELAQAE